MSDEQQPQADQPERPQEPASPQQPAFAPPMQQPHPGPPQSQPFSPQAPGDPRQWVPVPPPHPYASTPPTGPAGPAGKGFAIAAMALGLLAVFTVVVATFYHGVYAWVGALFGIVAVVLGIVALVKRQRPRAGGIVGVAAGAVAMISGLAVTALVLVALVLPDGPASGEGSGGPGASGEEWTPETETEAKIGWPANMASGGVLLTGPGDPRPVPSEPLQPGTAPLLREVDRESVDDVLIYVDYRCPHCLLFEQTNSAFLEAAVASGGATVEIVPLSFMDRASEGAYYSSRAAGAIACIADAQPDGVWRAHHALLSPEVQPGQGPGLDNAEIASVLDDAVGGLSAEARSCIAEERFATFAQALNNWVFANPVPNANDQTARISGTPSVFVNGEFYTGGSDDAEAFQAFFERQTR